jgi:hypothetical protein
MSAPQRGLPLAVPSRQPGMLPRPLLPAPGKPENVFVVSGFTETQLALLRKQARPHARALRVSQRASASLPAVVRTVRRTRARG